MSRNIAPTLFCNLLAILIIITFSACHIPAPFTQKEQECANQLSGFLDGATVNLSKSIDLKEDNNRHSTLTIGIEGFNYTPSSRYLRLLFASSLPAYVFYQNGMEKDPDYASIGILLKTADTTIRTRYSIAQLKQIEASLPYINAFVHGMVSTNADSITYASDSIMLSRHPSDTIIQKVKEVYQEQGNPKDMTLTAFQFESREGRDLIHFYFYMALAKDYRIVDLWTTPQIHKVTALNF